MKKVENLEGYALIFLGLYCQSYIYLFLGTYLELLERGYIQYRYQVQYTLQKMAKMFIQRRRARHSGLIGGYS